VTTMPRSLLVLVLVPRSLLVLVLVLVLALASACSEAAGPCGAGPCEAGPLAQSGECGDDGACPRLEELSQGCLGSHSEQRCTLCGIEFTRADRGDLVDVYFDSNGRLAAVQVRGEQARACGWFGADLSGCIPSEELRRVPCENASE
jgi:hypothetical protein